jgi:hypothetical protein
MLAAIEEWRRSTCIERAYWRSTARHQIREYKRLHVLPQRQAFREAVARSQHMRDAA